MAKSARHIAIQELHRRFSYDPASGVLTYRIRRGSKAAGKTVGCGNRWSLDTSVDGKSFPVSHIIWAMQTGAFPDEEIDHINRNWRDNRWCNLRQASRRQNTMNRLYKVKRNGLPKGIMVNKKGRFFAQCGTSHVGTFDTVRDARIAHGLAMLERYGEFACFDDRPTFQCGAG